MWRIEYHKEAVIDLKKLDHSQRLQVVKAIRKVSANPLPRAEGGYGKPLGTKGHIRLAGYFKIKLKRSGLRVVYSLVREHSVMKIIVISVRKDNEVYFLAQQRTDK